jgi:hypothetical protein
MFAATVMLASAGQDRLPHTALVLAMHELPQDRGTLVEMRGHVCRARRTPAAEITRTG